MSDYTSEFIDAMHKAGLSPVDASEIAPTQGKWANYHLAGDKKRKPKGAYRLTIDQDGAVGQFKDRRIDDPQTWSSRASKDLTQEERKEYAKRIEAMRKASDKKLAEAQDAAALEAAQVWKNSVLAMDHPYLKRKGIQAHGIKINQDGDLIIPRYDFKGKLWSYQTITKDGDKKYQFQGRTNGTFYPLASKEDDKSRIYICEGFATGASVREATSCPVMVAFDSGNLLAVAKETRNRYKDAEIIMAADNDIFTFGHPRAASVKNIEKEDVAGDDPRWNEWRDAGYLYNTGLQSANAAAHAIDGRVIWPEFAQDDLIAKPTDFNDLHQLRGLDAVKDRLSAVAPEEIKLEELERVPDCAYQPEFKISGDFGLPFTVLGFNEGKYYYIPFRQRQIVSMTASAHTMNNLFQLCDLVRWEEMFEKVPHNKIPTLAADRLMSLAHERGAFHEADSVRGSGLWPDKNRLVYNSGKELYVDGELSSWENIMTNYVYVSAPKMPLPSEALIMADRQKFIKIFTSLCWENPLSGILLAGWIVTAPLCATFEWRPHLWITGEAGSGKSTILKFVKRALVGLSLNFDGKTTEPKIREKMSYNVRPVVFDEAENGKSDSSSINAVIELARVSSSGGEIGKFGQRDFKAQSMFCFASVNPAISTFADETRITKMVLKKNISPTALEEYFQLETMVEELFTDGFSNRLVATVMDEYHHIHANYKTIRIAARENIKDPRAAQQIAVLLAGYWLLYSGGLISTDKAKEIVSSYSWDEHTAINQETEQEQLLHYISQSTIRIQSIGRDMTIGELIATAAGQGTAIENTTANNHLKAYSIKVEGKKVFIGNRNKNLSTLLRNTTWGLGWGRQLGNLEGAEKLKDPVYFCAGDRQRATTLPLTYFVDDGYVQPKIQELIPDGYYEEEIVF